MANFTEIPQFLPSDSLRIRPPIPVERIDQVIAEALKETVAEFKEKFTDDEYQEIFNEYGNLINIVTNLLKRQVRDTIDKYILSDPTLFNYLIVTAFKNGAFEDGIGGAEEGRVKSRVARGRAKEVKSAAEAESAPEDTPKEGNND